MVISNRESAQFFVHLCTSPQFLLMHAVLIVIIFLSQMIRRRYRHTSQKPFTQRLNS